MDDNQVRTLGLAGGGAALLIAVALAFVGEDKSVEAPAVAAQVVAPAPSVSATTPIPPAPGVEVAAIDGRPPMAVVKPTAPLANAAPQNPNLEFLVRFDDRHPLAQAQTLWMEGRREEAETLARATLPQRAEFRGLCYSRFTLGAELVLAHCTRVPRAQIARTSDRWVRKIRGTRGVQYVDANVIVGVETK